MFFVTPCILHILKEEMGKLKSSSVIGKIINALFEKKKKNSANLITPEYFFRVNFFLKRRQVDSFLKIFDRLNLLVVES